MAMESSIYYMNTMPCTYGSSCANTPEKFLIQIGFYVDIFSNKFAQLSNVIAVVDFNKMIRKREEITWSIINYLFIYFFYAP